MKVLSEKRILETSSLVLMVSGTGVVGKSLIF